MRLTKAKISQLEGALHLAENAWNDANEAVKHASRVRMDVENIIRILKELLGEK